MSSRPVHTADQESKLWTLACADDADAYREFVGLCERRIRCVLGRLLDDGRDVEEAAQDTFVQAWRHRHRFRGGSRPFTWLYRIAVNEAAQRNRRLQLETHPFDEGIDSGRAPIEASVENRELAQALLGSLKSLPFEQRSAVLLRDIEGCSNQEVANALGVSLAAAKSRIHRGRAHLRDELAERLDLAEAKQ